MAQFIMIVLRAVTLAIVAVLAIFHHLLWSTPSLESLRVSLVALGVTCALLGFGPALIAEALRSRLDAIELEVAELRTHLFRSSVITDTGADNLRQIR